MMGEWVLEAEIKLNNKTMEERLIEAFGCFAVNERAVKIYSSLDRARMKREFLVGGRLVDSETTDLAKMEYRTQLR
jgi:hypothetical protein